MPNRPAPNDVSTVSTEIARKLAAFESASASAVLIGDSEGRIEWANAAAVRLTGLPASALLGRQLTLFPHDPEAEAHATGHVRERLARGEAARLEAEVRDRHGEARWIAIEVQPLAGDGGAPPGFVARATDVTDRRRAVAELEERGELLRALVEESPEPMAVHADGRVVFVNRAALDLLGAREPDDVLGRPVLDFVHRDYHAVVSERIFKMEQVGDPAARLDEKLVGVDGRVIDVEMSAAPITWRGGPAILLVARDLRERRRAEAERRAHEARARDERQKLALATFAAGVAKDFDALLRDVLAHADGALEDTPADSPVGAALKRIRAAALRASGYTRGILTYAGERRISRAPLDLSSLAVELSQLAQPMLPQDLSVTWDLAGNLPLVEGDRTALREVGMALLANAADALDGRRGSVVVRTRMRELGPGPHPNLMPAESVGEGRYVALEVADNGAGMDATTRARIFDPFFSTRTPGRGLGLAAALGVVRAHGGALELDTAPGRGTRASLLLPASPRARRLSPRKRPLAVRG